MTRPAPGAIMPSACIDVELFLAAERAILGKDIYLVPLLTEGAILLLFMESVSRYKDSWFILFVKVSVLSLCLFVIRMFMGQVSH